MLPPRELKIFEPSIEEIRAQKNSGRAFGLACDCSRLDAKEIYMELGFDAAQFSRIKSARATVAETPEELRLISVYRDLPEGRKQLAIKVLQALK